MSYNVVQTDQAPQPVGPYSQAIAAGGFVFCSGQIALDPVTNVLVGAGDVAVQTQQVLTNLQAVLGAAGTSLTQVVKTTIFLADMNDFAIVNSIYAGAFDADRAPARATVEVSRLPKDALVEIECIALV